MLTVTIQLSYSQIKVKTSAKSKCFVTASLLPAIEKYNASSEYVCPQGGTVTSLPKITDQRDNL